MVQKIVFAILNWLAVKIVWPIINFFIDYYKLKKHQKETREAVRKLKEAKTKEEINEAIDNLP